MNPKLIEVFMESVQNTLTQFGIQTWSVGPILHKENMVLDNDVHAFVGVVNDWRGNISYSFNEATAKMLASTLMMGFPVEFIDEMAGSALSELANMLTGAAASSIAAHQVLFDITPPSLLTGEALYIILSSIASAAVTLETNIGSIEINFGIES